MRFLPLALAAAAIAAASLVDFSVNYDSGDAEAWARVIEQGVPKELGDWVGEDTEVDETTTIVAGAVGKVSRAYRNKVTGDVVNVWLIVGHMQAVTRHVPTMCYPNAGFEQEESPRRHEFVVEGAPPGNEFWTSWFLRDSIAEATLRRRVFWAWTLPKPGEPIVWNAPDAARYRYSGAKALFKLYFTTNEPEDKTPLSENPSNDFAEEFLPMLATLLDAGPENFEPASGGAAPDAVGTDAGEASGNA